MTVADKDRIIKLVQERLTALGKPLNIDLRVDPEQTQLEDGWLYVTVFTPLAGVRVSEFAEWFAEIEDQLRGEIEERMLLVPAIP